MLDQTDKSNGFRKGYLGTDRSTSIISAPELVTLDSGFKHVFSSCNTQPYTNDRSYIVEDFFNTPLGSKPAAFRSPGVGEKRDLTFDTTIL